MATQIAPLPTPPTGFGLDNLPANGPAFGPEGQWGPMYNDALLTCVEAAFIHATMYWTHAATGVMAPFLENDARTLYSTLTGYVIGNPATDHGTDDWVGFDYWTRIGINDDNGVNHKLTALYQIPTGDVDALAQAAYLCGAVYVGVAFTTQWSQTLLHSAIWDALASPTFNGVGHTFPVFGRSTNGNFITTSFGSPIQMTPAGYLQFSGGAYAMISEDWINPDTGKAPNGYTLPQIEQYIKAMAIAGFTPAHFTGTGTLSAAIRPGVTAQLSGAGTLSATVTPRVAAAFTGAGTLAAAVSAGVAAAFTGAGTLAAAVLPNLSAAFTGTGTLAAAVAAAASAAFTGTGTLSAAVSPGLAAAFAGAGTLTAAVSPAVSPAFTGTGTLSATVVENDPSIASVVALLHLNGSNGSTTFTDSSPLAANFTVINSTPTISTTQSEFGGASLSATATSQVGASAASSNFVFGTADFTIELWVYGSSFSGIQILYDQRPTGVSGLYPTIYLSAGIPNYLTNSVSRIVSGAAVSTSTWHHIAVSRVSGSTKMFVDGTQVGSTYTDSNSYLNPAGRPYLGNSNAASSSFSGFIDDVRVTKGVGRYSATFTPRTTAFPNQ